MYFVGESKTSKLLEFFLGGGEPHHPLLQTKGLGIPVAECAEEVKLQVPYITLRMPHSETRVPSQRLNPDSGPPPEHRVALAKARRPSESCAHWGLGISTDVCYSRNEV